VVQTYNYLGCLVDDSLKLDAATAKKKQLEKRLDHSKYLLSTPDLDSATRYHTWQSLFKGRLWYSLVLTSKHSEKAKEWLQSYVYRSIKAYFGIQTNTDTEKTYREVMNCDSQTVWQSEVSKLEHRLAPLDPAVVQAIPP
jgi:hypothetical protein